MVPLLVYLDSSDFSTLSNPGRSNEQEVVRSQLTGLTESGLVQFVFSGTHLMEMAPLSSTYTPAAAARADLLVELCGRNAVISFDKLVKLELGRLAEPTASTANVVSTTAEWYPEWGNMISPVQWVDAIKEVDITSRQHGLNRQQRRQLKKGLFKDGRPKKVTLQFLADNGESNDYKELVQRYPMREQDARVLGWYVVGKATAVQANEAFLESLRDPRWMMRWFAEHHGQLSPFVQYLREPAEKLLASVADIADAAHQMHKLRDSLGPSYQPEFLTANGWNRLQDATVLNIANRCLKHFSLSGNDSVTANDVDNYCPGLSAFIRSVHSAVRDSTSETPRQSKGSDFVDGVHAMYAPYVDIFRADSYMASHIRRCVEGHGTTVVPKLSQLVSAIDDRLGR